jgi:carboxyl-terminal processing protease
MAKLCHNSTVTLRYSKAMAWRQLQGAAVRWMSRVLIGWLVLGLPVWAASLEEIFNSLRHTNVTPLVESPDDSNIVRWVGFLVERSHYNRQPFDEEMSSKFLDRYLDALDPQHLYFTQEDLREFEPYRFKLHQLTKRGDSSPARVIFTRFRERLEQQVSYIEHLLKTEHFDFSGEDRFLLNRRKEPRPKDLEAARWLWRERLRYEYLQEKLSIGRPETIAAVVREKLEQKQPQAIAKALHEKLSTEKAEQIAKLAQERFQQGQSPAAVAEAVQRKLEQDNAEEIVKIIARRYYRVLRTIHEYDYDDVLQVYLTALAHVYDPHSDYFGKSEFDNFTIGMSLKLYGIGAVLTSEDGYCKIRELKPGPALRSKKLNVGDRIVAVAQSNQPPVDVVDMKLNKIVEMIRGPKGTEVRLTVIPADAPDPSVRKVVTLIRDEIKLEDQAAKARIIELPVDSHQAIRLGVIDLPSFYSELDFDGKKPGTEGRSTTADVARLLTRLKQEQVSGIILDLRRNGGGSLEEAIRLTGLFIKEGPVVQVQAPQGPPMVDRDPDPSVLYEGPLVVLTSRFSASASEILAAALQDYDRALIVGDCSTHGKGTVQSLIKLEPILRANGVMTQKNPGALKVTIRKFYRVTGSSTQEKGVTPDIVLPSVNNYLDVGETELENRLPWDTIKPVEFAKLNCVSPYLEELRRRSERRVATDPDFEYIRQEIERYRKSKEDKTVSLNEAQRLKEKQEVDERAKQRKKELASRPPPAEKACELLLAWVDWPGLPPPFGSSNQQAFLTWPLPSERHEGQADLLPAPETECELAFLPWLPPPPGFTNIEGRFMWTGAADALRLPPGFTNRQGRFFWTGLPNGAAPLQTQKLGDRLACVRFPVPEPPLAQTTNAPAAQPTAAATGSDTGPEAKAKALAQDAEPDEPGADEKLPQVDPTLEEAKRILVDLITLSGQQHLLALSQPAGSSSPPAKMPTGAAKR